MLNESILYNTEIDSIIPPMFFSNEQIDDSIPKKKVSLIDSKEKNRPCLTISKCSKIRNINQKSKMNKINNRIDKKDREIYKCDVSYLKTNEKKCYKNKRSKRIVINSKIDSKMNSIPTDFIDPFDSIVSENSPIYKKTHFLSFSNQLTHSNIIATKDPFLFYKNTHIQFGVINSPETSQYSTLKNSLTYSSSPLIENNQITSQTVINDFISDQNCLHIIFTAIIFKLIDRKFSHDKLEFFDLFSSIHPKTQLLGYILLIKYSLKIKFFNFKSILAMYLTSCIVASKTQIDGHVMNSEMKCKGMSSFDINYLEGLLLNTLNYNLKIEANEIEHEVKDIRGIYLMNLLDLTFSSSNNIEIRNKFIQ